MTRSPSPPRGAAAACFIAAGVFGTVHGGWSLYWAAGGTALLDTVGAWALELAREGGAGVRIGLAAIGVLKVIAAWFPWFAATGRMRWPRWWRPAAWAGSSVLVLYGAVNAVAAAAVLGGWIEAEGADRRGLVGHAYLWDPLFALWGAALLVALVLTAPRRGSSAAA